MLQRFTLLLPIALLALTVAMARDDATVPPPPKVPSKVDLPPKNFSQAIPGTTVKFEMIYVPGGEFLLGSPATEAGREENEGPQVRVKVRPYWIAKCECTWDEFDEWWRTESLL